MASPVPVSSTVKYLSSSSGEPDLLRPTLICYRGMKFRKLTKGSRRQQQHGPGRHPYKESEEEEEEECFDEVQELANGDFETTMSLPSVFFKYIIGKEGKTRMTIEKDTGCKLRIPHHGQDGPVVIRGPNRRPLLAARKRIDVIVWSNRMKEAATHFICIPLNASQFVAGLEDFHSQVWRVCSHCEGMDEVLFQIPAKTHLTLVMLRLFSKEEEERAVYEIRESLRTLQDKFGSLQFSVKLAGIESMNDDPSAVDVLYAKVFDSSGKVQQFVDALASDLPLRAPDLFEARRGRQEIKLHATVMNSKYRERLHEEVGREQSAERRRWRKRESFDARKIFSHFKKFEFGEHTISELHLSKRGEYGVDGFYKCVAEFDLSRLSATP